MTPISATNTMREIHVNFLKDSTFSIRVRILAPPNADAKTVGPWRHSNNVVAYSFIRSGPILTRTRSSQDNSKSARNALKNIHAIGLNQCYPESLQATIFAWFIYGRFVNATIITYRFLTANIAVNTGYEYFIETDFSTIFQYLQVRHKEAAQYFTSVHCVL